MVMLVGLSMNILPVLLTSSPPRCESSAENTSIKRIDQCTNHRLGESIDYQIDFRAEKNELQELRVVMLVGLSMNILPVLLTSFLRGGAPQVHTHCSRV